MSKIIHIPDGILMIVSDIHGNLQDYQRIMMLYEQLQEQGRATHLILMGDLVHGYPGYPDQSLDIIDDLTVRQAQNPKIICLLGNHEFVHIYHLVLYKGWLCLSSGLEQAWQGNRASRIALLQRFPLAVTTAGGVLITHAGAAHLPPERWPALYQQRTLRQLLADLDHEQVIAAIQHYGLQPPSPDTLLSPSPLLGRIAPTVFQELTAPGKFNAEEFTPWIGQFFMATDLGQCLWELLMNKNEWEYGLRYQEQILPAYLQALSLPDHPLHVVVSGHIRTPPGYLMVGEQQLRLSTCYGAEPGCQTFLLLPAQARVFHNTDLGQYLATLPC